MVGTIQTSVQSFTDTVMLITQETSQLEGQFQAIYTSLEEELYLALRKDNRPCHCQRLKQNITRCQQRSEKRSG